MVESCPRFRAARALWFAAASATRQTPRNPGQRGCGQDGLSISRVIPPFLAPLIYEWITYIVGVRFQRPRFGTIAPATRVVWASINPRSSIALRAIFLKTEGDANRDVNYVVLARLGSHSAIKVRYCPTAERVRADRRYDCLAVPVRESLPYPWSSARSRRWPGFAPAAQPLRFWKVPRCRPVE